MPLLVALLAAVALAPQGPDARPAAARPPFRAAARVTAARAVQPPVIDGKDDDGEQRDDQRHQVPRGRSVG